MDLFPAFVVQWRTKGPTHKDNPKTTMGGASNYDISAKRTMHTNGCRVQSRTCHYVEVGKATSRIISVFRIILIFHLANIYLLEIGSQLIPIPSNFLGMACTLLMTAVLESKVCRVQSITRHFDFPFMACSSRFEIETRGVCVGSLVRTHHFLLTIAS